VEAARCQRGSGALVHPSKLRYFQLLSLPQWDPHPDACQRSTSAQTPSILACTPKSGCVCGDPNAPARGDRCPAALATGTQSASHHPDSTCEAAACQGESNGGFSLASLHSSSLLSCLDLLALLWSEAQPTTSSAPPKKTAQASHPQNPQPRSHSSSLLTAPSASFSRITNATLLPPAPRSLPFSLPFGALTAALPPDLFVKTPALI